MPSVLRRYDDVGAPQLSGNTPGSLINVLKAVLVDGYGTQGALGWSLEFEDVASNTAVFRQGGSGIRPHVQVRDNVVSTTFQTAIVTAYESMSDALTGNGPCPPLSLSDDWKRIMKCTSNSSANIPWVIIGDELGFYLLVRAYDTTGVDPNNGSLYYIHYIGDWVCNIAENNYNFITVLTNANGFGYFKNNLTTIYNIYLMRHPDTLEIGSVQTAITWHYCKAYSMLGYTERYKSPINGRYLYYPVMVYLNNDPTYGVLPGIYNQLWYRLNNNQYQTVAELVEFYDEIGNERMFVFAVKHDNDYYNGQVSRGAILIGEGFRNAS